jgi:hypothetical protein
MTTESNHNDPRVSEAYQGLATEGTPPELDRRILAMAASKSRSRYGMARAWVRPVAWAATIGLSLAIVLEISQLKYETTPQLDADNVETLEEALIPDDAPAREDDDNRTRRESAKRSDAPAPAQLSVPAAEQARSRSGSEPAAAASVQALSFDAATTPEKKEQGRHCDPDLRSSAETWYKCIEDLRAQGLADAADSEFLLLLAEFPDFEKEK